MTRLSGPPPGGTPVPALVRAAAGSDDPVPVWRNELGGLTYRAGDRYLKWSPPGGPDLEDEAARMAWAAAFHPVPQVIDLVRDDAAQLLVTRAISGVSAVAVDPRSCARAVGEGLRALHEHLPVDACPFTWSVEDRGGSASPPVDLLVVAHGDPCIPNTLVGSDGHWIAHVDLGRLGVADRWADLAVGSANLTRNLGPGLEDEYFAAYGVARDEERIRFYRELWDSEDSGD